MATKSGGRREGEKSSAKKNVAWGGEKIIERGTPKKKETDCFRSLQQLIQKTLGNIDDQERKSRTTALSLKKGGPSL